MFCNFGPILIQAQLFFTNLEIFKALRRGQTIGFPTRIKREKILSLLMKIAICELVCESLGQGILQAYILSQQLGKEDICLPDGPMLRWSLKGQEDLWHQGTLSRMIRE